MKKVLSVPVLGTAAVFLSLVSIFIGVKSLSVFDLGSLDDSQFNILLSSRIPRTISLLIAGSSLAVCGLTMQQLTQNRFVSPTTAGTMDWAKLGVVISIIFFSKSSLLLQLTVSSVFVIFGSLFFVYLLRVIRFKDEIFIPLVGLMLGQVVSAISTFLGVQFQILQSVNSWLEGNFSIITSHRYEILFLVLPCLLVTYLYAHQFTIAGLGEDFSKNLGLNYQAVINLGLIIVSIMTAVIVTIIGRLPFLGLIVPNMISNIKGDNMKKSLTLTSLLGAVIVLSCDILGRLLIFPHEISIGLTMGIVGSSFFLYFLLKGRKSW
ncbi:ABC transporter permease [Streptococcus orisasini]|uniref:ABC transporter permease n=1 Tax=Streptococcus orisasini TaxID=1080071 RepID=UPI00070C3FF2|nr:iron chelate uptake ABC transporter family permease subunit [Streptococcus orisasini]